MNPTPAFTPAPAARTAEPAFDISFDATFEAARTGSARSRPVFALAVALLLGASLAACNKADDDRSAGQKLDAAVAKTEQKAGEIKADAKEMSRDTKQAANQAGETMAGRTRDMGITTSVKTKLAADSQLSALAIDVDTSNSRVVLRGSAPSAAARERATEIAQRTDGVTAVSNELKVSPRP